MYASGWNTFSISKGDAMNTKNAIKRAVSMLVKKGLPKKRAIKAVNGWVVKKILAEIKRGRKSSNV